MNNPYRVVVWGTGNIGKATVKLAAGREDVEIVGAWVHSESKEGRDLGTIVGISPLGVTATLDREAVLALAPDCILYTPMWAGDFSQSDADIVSFLERGINVVTPLPYQNLNVRGQDVVERFQRAGEAGSATLYGAGINPGFFPERLAVMLTGLCGDVDDILIEEFYLMGGEPPEAFQPFGLGVAPPAEDAGKSPVASVMELLEQQFIYYIGDVLGTPVIDVEYSADWFVAPKDLPIASTVVAEGTVAYVNHRWSGRTKNGPTIRFQNHWFLSSEMVPDSFGEVPCEDYYRITVEGRPSVRVGLELKASARENARFFAGDDSEPVYYATAGTMLQAIPGVIAHPPGVQSIAAPSNAHWRADLRD